jgi:hypothetical protein
MEQNPGRSHAEKISHLYSEKYYYEQLAELEGDLRLRLDEAPRMRDLGFTYLEPALMMVVPPYEDCYLPPDKASREERWGIGMENTRREQYLIRMLGKTNLWIGPPDPHEPLIEDLEPAEHRGYWARFQIEESF